MFDVQNCSSCHGEFNRVKKLIGSCVKYVKPYHNIAIRASIVSRSSRGWHTIPHGDSMNWVTGPSNGDSVSMSEIHFLASASDSSRFWRHIHPSTSTSFRRQSAPRSRRTAYSARPTAPVPDYKVDWYRGWFQFTRGMQRHHSFTHVLAYRCITRSPAISVLWKAPPTLPAAAATAGIPRSFQ